METRELAFRNEGDLVLEIIYQKKSRLLECKWHINVSPLEEYHNFIEEGHYYDTPERIAKVEKLTIVPSHP
jgi:hypothetical protein